MRVAETRTLRSRNPFAPLVEWFAESFLPLGKMILLVAFLATAGWLVMVATAK